MSEQRQYVYGRDYLTGDPVRYELIDEAYLIPADQAIDPEADAQVCAIRDRLATLMPAQIEAGYRDDVVWIGEEPDVIK